MWVVLSVMNVFKSKPCVYVVSVHATRAGALAACTQPEHQVVRIDYDA